LILLGNAPQELAAVGRGKLKDFSENIFVAGH